MGQKPENPPQSVIGAVIDLLRHGVVHKRVILMPDDAPPVSDLREVARALAAVGAAPMPDLIVEEDYAASRSQMVLYALLPLSAVPTAAAGWPQTDASGELSLCRRARLR